MKTEAPTLGKARYKGVKVSNTIRGLMIQSINKHLLLRQRDKVSIINNFYKQHKYVSNEQMKYLWRLYWNFVINDFRYKKKTTP